MSGPRGGAVQGVAACSLRHLQRDLLLRSLLSPRAPSFMVCSLRLHPRSWFARSFLPALRSWSDNGVFNIEGGCYAKAIGLKEVRRGRIAQGEGRSRVVAHTQLLHASVHGCARCAVLWSSVRPASSVLALPQENEPDIYHAIKFGCILENVVFDEVRKRRRRCQ